MVCGLFRHVLHSRAVESRFMTKLNPNGQLLLCSLRIAVPPNINYTYDIKALRRKIPFVSLQNAKLWPYVFFTTLFHTVDVLYSI